MTDATSDPNVPRLAVLPPGAGRWKVKWDDNQEYDGSFYYDLKVCLQIRGWHKFWFTYYSKPVQKISGQPLARAVESTALEVLKGAKAKAKADLEKKRVKGVYRSGNYQDEAMPG